MSNIAQLTIGVETKELKQGVIALETLAPAGAKAQKAADGVASSIENASKSAKRATQSLDAASSATARLSSTAGSAATATGRVAQAANQNRDAFGRFTKALNDNASAVARAGNEARKAAEGVGALNKSANLSAAALVGMAKGAAAAAAAAVSIGALVEAGRGVIETTKSFQTLKASLETVIGSAEKAGQAFEFAKAFAKTTPFDLAQVTEAIIKLKALGLNPTEEALTSFGNTASAMGKPLMQFIEAVADAATGEFERLKEFGIKASQDGDKVSLTFQGITKTIGNNAKDIQKYLIDIGNTSFAGGMDKQSKLLGGSLAAAGDSIEQFKNAIGEGGLAAAVKGIADNTANWLAENQALATSIGSIAGTVVVGLATAFDAVTTAIGESYKWIVATGQVIGELASGFLTGGDQIVAAGEGMVSVATTFNQSWMATGKIIYDVINGIIGAFVSAYRVISSQWEQLPTLFKSIAAAAANALINGIQYAVNGAISGINTLIENVNSIAPSFAQLGTIGTASLDGFKIAIDDAGQAAAESASSITAQAMSVDYLGTGLDSVVGVVTDFGGKIADAKNKMDQAAAATKNLGAATGTVKMPDLSSSAAAIDSGITKPSKEATKALKEAEAAKKKLMGEADAAVEKFFPFEAATAEAERLTAAINDTSNGLTDLQRNALRRQIDQNFIDAFDAVDDFEKKSTKSVKNVGKSIKEEIADSLSDAFTDALSSSDGFFKSLLSGFAGLGRQLTQNGFDQLFGKALGTAKPSSAANWQNVGQSMVSAGASQPLKIDSSDFARASGQMLQYSSRFNSNVDARLMKIMQTAASRFDMKVEAVSGLRPGDSRYHGKGLATDVQIYGADGKALNNYQDAATFRTYEKFAQLSKQVQGELFPELEGMLRWGGYFSGAKGKYGALDTMHFDLAGDKTGMGGGSWAEGLTAAMRKLWPGADSQGLTKAVKQGVQAGIDPWQGLRTVTPGAGVSGAAGGGGFTGSQAVGAIGAGLGIFSQGMQSQSPLMGAVSGALGGFSAGAALGAGLGPVGAVLGGIVGAVGGLFGKSKAKKQQKKAEREQAESAWDSNYQQFRELRDEVSRTQRGALTERLDSVKDALAQFDKIAGKTGSSGKQGEVNAVKAQMQSYIAFLSDNFIRDLPQTIGDIAKGFGTETTFAKARDAVMSMSDSYRALMGDIKTAFAVPVDQRQAILDKFKAAEAASKQTVATITQGYTAIKTDAAGRLAGFDFSGMSQLKKGNGKTSTTTNTANIDKAAAERDSALAAFDAKYGDALARMNAQLEAARNAAVQGLERMISGEVVEQTDIEKAIDEAQGAAAGARTAFIDLGKTMEETSAIIDSNLAKRMDRLRTDFIDKLGESIEGFDGKAYLADFRDLFEQLSSLGKDSSLLGLDGSLVEQYFRKAAQSLVDDSELAGDAFYDLLRSFPQLIGRVNEFQASTEEAAKSLADINLEKLDKARDLLDRSYDAEVDAINKQIDAHNETISTLENSIDSLKDFRDSIKDFLTGLEVDSSLSPKSAQERLDTARAQFNDIAAKAAAGDVDAQGKLASASQTLLQESRDFWGDSEQYYADFNGVKATLASTLSATEHQISAAEASLQAEKDAVAKLTDQLTWMEKQYNALLQIDKSVVTLAEAMAQYSAAAAQVPVSNGGTATTPTQLSTAQKAANYLANNADVRSAIAGGMTFGSGSTNANDQALAHYLMYGQKEGRAFAGGGMVRGAGNGTSDSIAAWVSDGEFINRSASVNHETRPILEHINETGRAPVMPAPVDNEGNKQVVAALIAVGMQITQAVASNEIQIKKLQQALRNQ